MKKTLLLLAAIVFAVTACDTYKDGEVYKGGEYSVEYDALDSHGWKAFVNFTLSDDVIDNVDYDYVDADGNFKSEDTAYQSRMAAFGKAVVDGDTISPGIGPADYCPDIEMAIEATTIIPEYVEIDNVTGATHSVENANELMEKGLQAAVDGTTEVSVPQPDPAE